jgi:hypothetical protein
VSRIIVEPRAYHSCTCDISVDGREITQSDIGSVRFDLGYRNPNDEYGCRIIGFDEDPYEQVIEEYPWLKKEDYDYIVSELNSCLGGECADCC